MAAFDKILEAARRRVGAAELRARMPAVSAPDALRAVADDRYLSLMSRRIFRAGLKHSLVDDRWPAFEEVFHGFDLRRVRALNHGSAICHDCNRYQTGRWRACFLFPHSHWQKI